MDINKAYSWAINTCNAPNVGYSQAYRNQQTIGGITYYDCSSFIWYALIAGGWDCVSAAGSTWPFTTYTIPEVLTKLGFTLADVNGRWLPGDIALASYHTEMVYQEGEKPGEGITMGAHTDNAPLPDQVSINNYTSNANAFPQIWRYGEGGASGFGSSLYVCAAMAGNFWQESGLNPGIWEGLQESSFDSLGHGYGLGQWTNTGGDTHGRLWKLHEYLVNNNYQIDDGVGQLNFLIEENVWYPNAEAAGFENLQAFLTTTSTDLTLLTHAWNIGWEGIHDGSWDDRVTYAENCLKFIQEHGNDASITEWITGNRYLSDEERYNNAVMLYRFLSAGGGGGGTIGKEKHKMPLWMKLNYNKYTITIR